MPSDNCFIDSVHILYLLFVGKLLHCKLLYHGQNQKSQIYWTFHSIFMYVNLDSVCHLLAILSYFKSLFHFLDILKIFFHITCHIILTSELKKFFWIVSDFFFPLLRAINICFPWTSFCGNYSLKSAWKWVPLEAISFALISYLAALPMFY